MPRKEILNTILTSYNSNDFDFDVYIVADLQERTHKNFSNQVIHADDNEFFSRTEFAEIASAIFYTFGFAKVFYSELEFIKYILDNEISHNECIVYNFARDGRANGKKSLIPSFCDLLGIKYTGCDASVISLLRNKYIYSKFLEKHGISIPKSIIYSNSADFSDILGYFGRQIVIAKSRYESASIGLGVNNVFQINKNSKDRLSKLLETMKTDSLLLQEYIDGPEYEILVLQYKGEYYALEPVEIVFKTDYNFIDSESSNSYNYNFEIPKSPIKSDIQEMAKKAAKLLGIKDYARFDFRIRDNVPYLFDIAGTPYTIYHSSIAYLFTNYYHLPYESIYKIIVTCMLSNYALKV